MSSMSTRTLECRVEEILQDRLKQYGQLNQLADQMLGGRLSPEQAQAVAEQMRQISQQLEAAERSQQALVEEFRQSQASSSATIAAVKQELAHTMQNFLMKISQLEQNALKSKEALLPQIHAGLRAVQMKNAYGKYV